MTIYKAEFVGDSTLFNGKPYKGTDQIGRLCRELQTGTLECYRGEMLCMTFDVAERKELRLYENQNGMGFLKYVPFDRSVFTEKGAQ